MGGFGKEDRLDNRSKRYLWIFANEVEKQVNFALDSWHCFEEKVNSQEKMNPDFLSAYADIHNMLNHTAIIAKLISPNINSIRARKTKTKEMKEKCQAQAKIRKSFFKEALDLGNQSPPYLDKSVRNGLEHFDERIDEWYSEIPESASFCWAYIEISEGVGITVGGVPFRNRRHLNLRTSVLTIFDDQINLRLLANSLKDLHHKIKILNNELFSVSSSPKSAPD